MRTAGYHGHPRATFCANAEWYGYRGRGAGYKAKMMALVGMTATTPDAVLRSSDAYDVAYRHLYNLLPDCGPDCCCTGLLRTL